jgi:hypothetical protein
MQKTMAQAMGLMGETANCASNRARGCALDLARYVLRGQNER